MHVIIGEMEIIQYLFFNKACFTLLDTTNRIFSIQVWDTMFLRMDTRFYVAGIQLDTDKNSSFKPCKNTKVTARTLPPQLIIGIKCKLTLILSWTHLPNATVRECSIFIYMCRKTKHSSGNVESVNQSAEV